MNKPFAAASGGESTGIPNAPRPDAEATQVLTDRMASVGKLVAGLAHEMNNPLASVLANLELAQVDAAEMLRQGVSGALLDGLRQELRNARESAERVRQILHDLRVFSRAEDEEPGPVDVAEVVDTSLRIARNAIRYRARIVKDYERVSPVLATETGLAQAFLNIVTSATAAMEEGDSDNNEIRVGIRNEQGQVVVEIGRTSQSVPDQSDTLPCQASGGRAELSPSIPISQHLVTGFGGNLEVLEQPNSGVAFRVSLPPVDRITQPERTAIYPASSGLQRCRVLVVVEDPMNAKAIRRALEKEHEIIVAETAKAALEWITGGRRFDVILCDLMMVELTGMDLHAELARVAPDQANSMVFLTSCSLTPKARTFLQATPNQRIEKPFDTSQLREIMRQRAS